MIGALLAASAGFKMLGAFQNAQIQKTQSAFFSRQARANAQVALELGSADEAVMDRQQQFRRGAIASGYAAHGVEVGKGSPLQVLMEQTRIDSYARIRRGYASQLQAHNLEVSAASSDYRGSVALTQGILSALGSATGTAGSLSSMGGGGSTTSNLTQFTPGGPQYNDGW